MPQLWVETYVSQFFWLLVILFSFHYFITIFVLPKIAAALKIRKKAEVSESEVVKEDSLTTSSSNLLVQVLSSSNDSTISTDSKSADAILDHYYKGVTPIVKS